MSDVNQSWVDDAEKYALFLNENGGGEAGKLLEISPTNRTIVGRKQAVILATLRFAAQYYTGIYPDKKNSYQWLNSIADIVEEYQLTIDGEQNSRRQFMKVAIANIAGMFKGNNVKAENAITK